MIVLLLGGLVCKVRPSPPCIDPTYWKYPISWVPCILESNVSGYFPWKRLVVWSTTFSFGVMALRRAFACCYLEPSFLAYPQFPLVPLQRSLCAPSLLLSPQTTFHPLPPPLGNWQLALHIFVECHHDPLRDLTLLNSFWWLLPHGVCVGVVLLHAPWSTVRMVVKCLFVCLSTSKNLVQEPRQKLYFGCEMMQRVCTIHPIVVKIIMRVI